ncbi:MAG: hypothetical protein FJ090_19970 [Deltaproteobacteria bacterium]|nr:hypothetical protein [Deltaproteobacteria bacterium]
MPPLPPVLQPVLLDGRLPALVAGVAFLLFGARVYGLLVVAPGIVGGLALGAAVGQLVGGPLAVSVAMVLAALAGAVICQLFEKVALAVGGVGLGTWLAWAAWPLVVHAQAPWWGLLGGACLGGLAFPRVYHYCLKPLTALLGAWTVAWSVHQEHRPWAVVGLAILGTAVQIWLGGKGGKKPAKKEP